MRLAFDTSILATRPPLRAEDLALLKEVGFELAIFRAFDGRRVDKLYKDGIYDCYSAGFSIAAYAVVLPDTDPYRLANTVVDVSGELKSKLEFVALDLEIAGIALQTVVESAYLLKTYGLRPIIYTRKSFYEPLGWGDALADLGLWYAHYDYRRDFSDFEEFGGWGVDKVVGKQYAANTMYGRMIVDENIFVDRSEDMQKGELEKIYTQLDALWGYSEQVRAAVQAIKDHLAALGFPDPRA